MNSAQASAKWAATEQKELIMEAPSQLIPPSSSAQPLPTAPAQPGNVSGSPRS
jgi:hypothetical protein